VLQGEPRQQAARRDCTAETLGRRRAPKARRLGEGRLSGREEPRVEERIKVLAGDPLGDLSYTPAVHARAARDVRRLADEMCGGRLMAFGGGGYDLKNLAAAWTAVLGELA